MRAAQSRRWRREPVSPTHPDGEQLVIDTATGRVPYKAADSMAAAVIVELLNEAEDRVNATMDGAGDGPG